MQCILVKSDEFENSYPLLYILLKSWLRYLKDNNAAAHSVDSDIFYEVIHLQLHVR